jgi:hypothetical protein
VVRSRDYLHADLAGEQAVEEREILSEVVEHVTCRWCNAQDLVEIVPRPASPGEVAEAAAGEPAR